MVPLILIQLLFGAYDVRPTETGVKMKTHLFGELEIRKEALYRPIFDRRMLGWLLFYREGSHVGRVGLSKGDARIIATLPYYDSLAAYGNWSSRPDLLAEYKRRLLAD
jgi:hypothetical protein